MRDFFLKKKLKKSYETLKIRAEGAKHLNVLEKTVKHFVKSCELWK